VILIEGKIEAGRHYGRHECRIVKQEGIPSRTSSDNKLFNLKVSYFPRYQHMFHLSCRDGEAILAD